MKMYNHASPDVTLRYVCWGKEDAEHDREAMYIGPKGMNRKRYVIHKNNGIYTYGIIFALEKDS